MAIPQISLGRCIPHDSKEVPQQEWAPPPAAITGPSTQPGLPSSFLSISTLSLCFQGSSFKWTAYSLSALRGTQTRQKRTAISQQLFLTGYSSITNSGKVNLSKLPETVEDRGAGVLLSMGSQIVRHDLWTEQQLQQLLTKFPLISPESFHTEKSYSSLVSLWWCANFKISVLLEKVRGALSSPEGSLPLPLPSPPASPLLFDHIFFSSPSSLPPRASQYFNVEWSCDLYRKWWCLDWFTLKHSPQIEVVFNNAKE